MIIQLGDLIQDKDTVEDKIHYEKGLSYLKKLTSPVYHVFGNHDQRYLTRDDLLSLTHHDELYYSFDIDDYHCIILYSDDKQKISPTIPDQEIAWLISDIQKTKNYCTSNK